MVHIGLDWDDVIPDDLRQIWQSNFEMMKEIGNLQFKRAVIPEDAVNLEVNTVDLGDASESMACIAVYVRFLRRLEILKEKASSLINLLHVLNDIVL